ncbi:MAG: macro domain-containing protein [Lachnospiraceae bacterium]|nr:macro domain-containing protein [Lachnospiraceae bacterium]
MPFKIVRNDITQMQTEAIVNTANDRPTVGTGCDYAVYKAAGYEELLSYREEKIGFVKEGDVFITPGFKLPSKYIIHAVSPLYIDGEHGEEDLLRSCYRKTLALAEKYGIHSIAFPLISTGGFGYPKEEGMRIAVDEIHAFLLRSEMQVYLVVFDEKATRMGRNLYPDLEAYIDRNYVQEKRVEEYGDSYFGSSIAREEDADESYSPSQAAYREERRKNRLERPDAARRPTFGFTAAPQALPEAKKAGAKPKKKKPGILPSLFGGEKEAADHSFRKEDAEDAAVLPPKDAFSAEDTAIEEMERKLAERMKHMSDTFPQYLLYLIKEKGLTNADVYKRAIVDKKVFSKIKNNPGYHPQKLTALCLCVGAKLNMDESRDLLARAGYALSPCDKTDIIFSYFIEHGIYDMIELDIQLEEHGLPCIIT